MVKFIKQEAEEKANEISVSAEEVRGCAGMKTPVCTWFWPASTSSTVLQLQATDATGKADAGKTCARNTSHCYLPQDFNIEKLQLLESEKAKIRKDYERREGQIEVKKKM